MPDKKKNPNPGFLVDEGWITYCILESYFLEKDNQKPPDMILGLRRLCMKSIFLWKLYSIIIIITIPLIGCSSQSTDESEDFPLISDASEAYVYNTSGNYFIQLVPSDTKIGHATIMKLMDSGNQKDEKNDGDSLIVSAYIHKFAHDKCDLITFDIYMSAKNNELYYIPRETRECHLRHEQKGYLEFADK